MTKVRLWRTNRDTGGGTWHDSRKTGKMLFCSIMKTSQSHSSSLRTGVHAGPVEFKDDWEAMEMREPEEQDRVWSQALETEKLMEIGKVKGSQWGQRDGRGQIEGHSALGLLKKWGIGPRCKLNLGNEKMCLLLAGSGKVGSGSSAKRGGKNICRNKSRKLGSFVDTRSCCHSWGHW